MPGQFPEGESLVHAGKARGRDEHQNRTLQRDQISLEQGECPLKSSPAKVCIHPGGYSLESDVLGFFFIF
jgi:hypothetical protein